MDTAAGLTFGKRMPCVSLGTFPQPPGAASLTPRLRSVDGALGPSWVKVLPVHTCLPFHPDFSQMHHSQP